MLYPQKIIGFKSVQGLALLLTVLTTASLASAVTAPRSWQFEGRANLRTLGVGNEDVIVNAQVLATRGADGVFRYQVFTGEVVGGQISINSGEVSDSQGVFNLTRLPRGFEGNVPAELRQSSGSAGAVKTGREAEVQDGHAHHSTAEA